MAKELMLGIRDNVEDIAASFKKMAIVNPERHKPVEILHETKPEAPAPKVVAVSAVVRQNNPELAAQIAALLEEQTTVRRRKRVLVNENQMTLFDVA
jgi:tRNA(Ser,Leu) C12 N-acetylase TAN1